MADTLVRKVMLQITGDDADAAAKLEAISVKAEELKRLNPELAVRIDTAAASAKMAVFRGELKATAAEMDDLKAKADKEEAGGIIGRFLSGSGGSGGLLSGLSGILGKLPLVGDQLAGIGDQAGKAAGEGGGLVESLGSVAGSGAGIAVVGGIIGAAATELAALATGLTAAGLGVGSFALLAMPAFKSVSTAYTQINTDQQAYDRALTATAKNNALKHLQQDYASLDPAQRGVLGGVQQLVGEYHKLSSAFEPTAFKVFNEGLQVANKLLPYVGQFANAAAPAIEGLLSNFSKGLDSPSFKKFTDFLSSLSGPAITAIGSGMSGLAGDVMQLMEQFSKKDVINGINIAFRLIGFALTAVIDIIKVSMGAWDLLTKAIHVNAAAFDTVRHGIATAGHDIATAFDTARHAAATFGHDTASAFDAARHGVATAADGIKNSVVSAVTRVVTTVKNDWKAVASWLVNPVATAVFEIRTHTHEIAQDFDNLRHETASILAGARHDISAAFDGIRHDVAAIVVGIPGDIRKQWDTIRHDAAALGSDVLKAAESAWTAVWHSITSTTSSGAAQTAGFFQKLPGQIVGFLAGLPGQMVTIGQNIVIGLYNGIVSMFNKVIGQIESLASTISKAFTNPLSIFSPSRVFYSHGVNVVQGLVQGIDSQQSAVHASMTRTAAAVKAGAPAVHAGAAGTAGGAQKLQLEFTGNANDQFWALFKKNVRVRGGNVQIVGA